MLLKLKNSDVDVNQLLEMKERCKYENVNSLNRLCGEKLWKAIESEEYFANINGEFLPTSELRFCVENVSEILSNVEIQTLVGDDVCMDFVGVDFSKLPTLSKLLDGNFWGVEAMLSSLDENFMMQKSDEWQMNFYRFLYNQRKVVSKLLRGKSEAFTKPWIKCVDGKFRALCSAGFGFTHQLYLNDVKRYEDSDINSLFTDVLHLTPFAEQSLTVDFVARQFHENLVQPLDYDTLAKYIMTAANEFVGAGFDFEKKKGIVEQFGNLQFLPTNKYVLSFPKMVLAETAAQRTFFADDADAVFLPNRFIEKHIAPSDRQTFYTFISACGVCFDVKIDTRLLIHPIDYKLFGISDEDMPSPSKIKETEIEDKEISGFSNFLSHPSLEKSLAFCRMLQNLLDKDVSTAVMQRLVGEYRFIPKGKRNGVELPLKSTSAYRQLFQSRWLMKTNGDFATVGEIASTDMLMPAYDEIPYSVFSFLGIALKKRDESAEAREALTLIRELERVGITKEDLKEMVKERNNKITTL